MTSFRLHLFYDDNNDYDNTDENANDIKNNNNTCLLQEIMDFHSLICIMKYCLHREQSL